MTATHRLATPPVPEKIERDAREKSPGMDDGRQRRAKQPQPDVLHDIVGLGGLNTQALLQDCLQPGRMTDEKLQQFRPIRFAVLQPATGIRFGSGHDARSTQMEGASAMAVRKTHAPAGR